MPGRFNFARANRGPQESVQKADRGGLEGMFLGGIESPELHESCGGSTKNSGQWLCCYRPLQKNMAGMQPA